MNDEKNYEQLREYYETLAAGWSQNTSASSTAKEDWKDAHASVQKAHAEWAAQNPGKNAGVELARCGFWAALGFFIGS